ncbi:DUF4148 domain-containing protein [uncultured Ramlibacter sp.]|uniref:DUF4148 domain-containing protein n=1 Tax=uncultured Ramlibacter sp. TaxID=260755 RepID=UPI00261E1513|nr:DUF4148 domain-containing protein [uncultured Ramlibacter sp.]
MNATKILAIAAIAAASFGAQADEADASQYGVQFNGGKSRAEVQAELASYKKTGVNPWSISYNPLAKFQSATTRAQVTAAYIADRDQVAALTGEDSGSAFLTASAPRRVRSALAGE